MNVTHTVYTLEGIGLPYLLQASIDGIQKIIIHFLIITFILILNLLMFIKLKKTLRAKRTVTTQNNSQIQERIKKSEARNAYMLIWTSPVTIIPNYMSFVINILQFLEYIEFYNSCADSIGDIVFSLQFAVSFIFYYSFNVNFKTVFNLLIRQILIRKKIAT